MCATLENGEYLFLGLCAEARMFNQYYIAAIPSHGTLEWSGNKNCLAELGSKNSAYLLENL